MPIIDRPEIGEMFILHLCSEYGCHKCGTLQSNSNNEVVFMEITARALATYLILGCVGRGVKLGSESSSSGGVWKSGNLEIGDLEIWKSGDLEIQKFGIQKIKKIKIIKIQIRSAQNVGKVWISRKKSSRPHLVPFQCIFWVGRKNQKTKSKKILIFLGGPMGPIHPVWGPVVVSFCFSLPFSPIREWFRNNPKGKAFSLS